MAKKYIDAEKLIAEIERYENTAIDAYNPLGEDADLWHGKVVACEDLKTLITSLQQEQPEVDLEKEINKEISKWTCYEEIGFGARYDAKPFDGRDIEKIARHFYGLGWINARKEEQK